MGSTEPIETRFDDIGIGHRIQVSDPNTPQLPSAREIGVAKPSLDEITSPNNETEIQLSKQAMPIKGIYDAASGTYITPDDVTPADELAVQQRIGEALNRKLAEDFGFGAIAQPDPERPITKPTVMPDGSIVEPLSIFDTSRFAPRGPLLEGRVSRGNPIQLPEQTRRRLEDEQRRAIEGPDRDNEDTRDQGSSSDAGTDR